MSCLKVDNLHESLTNQEFKRWFTGFGEVTSVHIKNLNGSRYGFVNFAQEDVAKTVYELQPVLTKYGTMAKICEPRVNNRVTHQSAPVVQNVLNTSFFGSQTPSTPTSPPNRSVESFNSLNSVEKVITPLETWQVDVIKAYYLDELNNILSGDHCKAKINSKTSITIIGRSSDVIEYGYHSACKFIGNITSRTFQISDKRSLDHFCQANKCNYLELFGQFEVYGKPENLDKLSTILKNSQNNSTGPTMSNNSTSNIPQQSNEVLKIQNEKLKAANHLFPRENPTTKLGIIDHIRLEVDEQYEAFYHLIKQKHLRNVYWSQTNSDSVWRVYYNKMSQPAIITTLKETRPVIKEIKVNRNDTEFVKNKEQLLKTQAGNSQCILNICSSDGAVVIKVIGFDMDCAAVKGDIKQLVSKNRGSSVNIYISTSELFKYVFLKRNEMIKNLFKDKFDTTFTFINRKYGKPMIVELHSSGKMLGDAKQELIQIVKSIQVASYASKFSLACLQLVYSTLLGYKTEIETTHPTILVNLGKDERDFKKHIKLVNQAAMYSLQIVSKEEIPSSLDGFFKSLAAYFLNFDSQKLSLPKGMVFDCKTISYDEKQSHITVETDSVTVASISVQILGDVVSQINTQIRNHLTNVVFSGNKY